MNAAIFDLINLVVQYATDYLMPLLMLGFILAVIARLLITITLHRQKHFVKEFGKRVHQEIMANPEPHGSFYSMAKRILTRTYFETFELRARYKRRNQDHVMTVGERVFLIQDGIIRLIDDFLKRSRYLRKDNGQQPDFREISNSVFAANPIFNRVLGIFSLNRTNDMLNILPSIFIVGGIFGTFLGIMKALPELTAMDITNAEASKLVIDAFLIKISFALSTSILGIVLSIIMSFMNTLLSPTNTYIEIVDEFNSATEIMWNKSLNNDVGDIDSGLNEREAEAVDAFDLAIASLHAGLLPTHRPVRGLASLGTFSISSVKRALSASFGDDKVPARKPGDGKLKVIEDAPGSYAKFRLDAEPEKKPAERKKSSKGSRTRQSEG